MIQRLVTLVLIAAALAMTPGPRVSAQGPPPPVQARLVLKDPPPNATYAPAQPIVVVVEVFNASPVPVVTTEGFARSEFWRRLFFTDPNGTTVANVGAAPAENERTFYCLSRNRVLQRPTAIPVVPVEVLPSGAPPAGFFVSYTIDDVRKYYDVSRPGRYTVDARVPVQTFDADTGALITDCDQLEGQKVANVSAIAGRRAFTAISNRLEFVVGSTFRLGGFRKPLVADTDCRNAPVSPCATVKLNRALWVEFQLFDAAGAPIATAQPRIALTKVGGGTVTLQDDEFAYHAGQREYRYHLHTRGLTPGVWRIDVLVDLDNSVHSAHIGLR